MSENIYMNRELSWLKFNSRVLEEAERSDVPLCERLSFASIYQSNLDEFFMVRVGSLIDQNLVDPKAVENKTCMTAQEQLTAVLTEVHRLNGRKDAVYHHLMGKLAGKGVLLVDFSKISPDESSRLEEYFTNNILPLLSPVVVGKRQPFPFLRNKDIYAVASLESRSGKQKMGIISCGSGILPRLIEVKSQKAEKKDISALGAENRAPVDGVQYILIEELILHFISKAFKDYIISEKSLIRVTRSADIDADMLYDDELDYREFMADLIKKRGRLAPLRLELTRELDSSIVSTLCSFLGISRDYVFRCGSPLDLSFLFSLQDCLRQDARLFYEKRFPQRSAQFRYDEAILPQIKEKDKLLSYPYESMQPFIRMLREAANDKDVVSVKMTLYRVAKHSEVVEALIEAAENGKDVLVLVELKARFDEENNIEWSRRLENAGCHVIYGLNGYKVHSKLCLITRSVNGETEYYTQIGTGNYNEKTARLYTDFCLMTCSRDIGEDASAVFQALAADQTVNETKALLVAPNCLQNKLLNMIDGEIAKGADGYIGIKINSLTDRKIIDALAKSSKAGVKVDMVVRGICCLIPGIAGDKTSLGTANIRVISIVGRFLEHSRIYIFGKGDDRKIYIASADLMTRNTLRRVEAAAPLYDEDIRRQVSFMFETMLRDNCQARRMLPDGSYERVRTNDELINSQELFYEKAYEQASRQLQQN